MARRTQRRPWWSEWPAALLLGLGTFSMVLTGIIPLLVFALLAGPDNQPAGTDVEFAPGPGVGVRILYVLLGLAFLAVPAFTVWAARRRLLGFLLLGLVAGSLVFFWGLAMLGVV